LIGVELFAGAGGLSLGAHLAGLPVAYAVEISKSPAKTFELNNPACNVIYDDIRKVDPSGFDLPSKRIALFGGPPCQGFSTSNQKNRNLENENNWLFEEFLRFVKALSPELVVFENVAGITHTAGGFFLDQLVSRLQQLGYMTSYSVINSADCGVPQHRNRFFCIGSKKQCIDLLKIKKNTKHVTVANAISDLPDLTVGNDIDILPYKTSAQSQYAKKLRASASICGGHLVTKNAPHIVERYKHIPQGGNWSSIPKELMGSYKDASRCHTGIYRRLQNDQPSVVLGNFRKNMLIHPNQDRGLSVREAARIQSFPDSYKFWGSIGEQQQQVGNAVPPLMAQKVFECIFDQVGETKR